MSGIRKSLLVAGLISLVMTGAVLAADTALVIGNRTYQRAGWIYGAEKALDAAADLNRAGYNVVSGRDLAAVPGRRALQEFLSRIDEAERLVVILSGHFVHSDGDTWLVPVDAAAPDRISIAFQGLSIRTILEIVAARPGQAAVFLGAERRQISLGIGLEPGIGNLEIPQGVFVATGPPAEIGLSVGRDFLQPGTGVASALRTGPQSLAAIGFVSDLTVLNPGEGIDPSGEMLIEEGYWRAMRELGNARGMRLYLDTYPNGRHAAEARDLLDAETSLTPLEKAEADEAALALSRDARRAIQEYLSLLGLDPRGIDGIFGPGTRAAIRTWQRQQGLEETGYLKRPQIDRMARDAARRASELAEEARRKQRELEDADRRYWQESGASAGLARGLRLYLSAYPDGLFADVAEQRLQAIMKENLRQSNIEERQAWQKAEAANTAEAYRAYLARYPRGVFADEANLKLSELEKEVIHRAEGDAASREEDGLNLNQVSRKLVETRLARLGFDPGQVDGEFDRKTRRAIRQFQRTRGFPVTGYLTRTSFVRLFAEAGN